MRQHINTEDNMEHRLCVWYADGSFMMARDCASASSARNLARVYAAEGKHVEIACDGEWIYSSDDTDIAAVYQENRERDTLLRIACHGTRKGALLARTTLVERWGAGAWTYQRGVKLTVHTYAPAAAAA